MRLSSRILCKFFWSDFNQDQNEMANFSLIARNMKDHKKCLRRELDRETEGSGEDSSSYENYLGNTIQNKIKFV